jgi:hypothetical protein
LLTTHGRNVEFLSFSRCVEEAVSLRVVDQDQASKLLYVNTLRNKVYHEGYMPRREEAEKCLAIAREFLRKYL